MTGLPRFPRSPMPRSMPRSPRRPMPRSMARSKASSPRPAEGVRPRGPRRAVTAFIGGVALAMALSACSGESPSLPTGRPTLPSVTLPSVTLPSVTLPTVPSVTLPTLPSVTLPTATVPTLPTASVGPTEPTASPEETATPTPEPTPSDTASPEEPQAEDETQQEATGDEGASWWPWLLLLAGLAAAVVGAVVLLRRRGARRTWLARVDESLPEAEWLRDSIVPDLIREGPDGRAGIWVVSRSRVVELEEALRRLGTEAPDPDLARPVAALTTAVESLRRLLDQADMLDGFGGPSVTAALHRSRAELDEAIIALRPPVPEGAQV